MCSRPRFFAGSLLALGGATLLACSALLDELQLDCDDSCDALNQRRGLMHSCSTYQCRADGRGCELRARDEDGDQVPDQRSCGDAGLGAPLDCDDQDESVSPRLSVDDCDGKDNDCDGTIDEDVASATLIAQPLAIEVPGPHQLAVASETPGQTLVAITGPNTGRSVATELHLVGSSMQGALTTVDPLDANCNASMHCNISEIAVAALQERRQERLIALGINNAGCPNGQARLGARVDWAPDATSSLSWNGGYEHDLGREQPSNSLADGFDPQAGCDTGASAPSLTLLTGFGPYPRQGLALWRAGPRQKSASPLVGRGIWVQDATLESAGSASSEELHAAAGPGRFPASIVAVRQGDLGGYVVAFDGAAGVEVAFVAPFASSATSIAPRMSASIDAQADGPPALARYSALAAVDGSSPGLAVAFRHGSVLSFTPLTLTLDAEPPLRLGKTLEIAREAEILEGPSLLFAREGFLARPEANARGGWLLVWREQGAEGSALMLARIAAADTRVLGVSRLQASPLASLPFAFLDAEERFQIGFVAPGPPPNLYIGAPDCSSPP